MNSLQPETRDKVVSRYPWLETFHLATNKAKHHLLGDASTEMKPLVRPLLCLHLDIRGCNWMSLYGVYSLSSPVQCLGDSSSCHGYSCGSHSLQQLILLLQTRSYYPAPTPKLFISSHCLLSVPKPSRRCNLPVRPQLNGPSSSKPYPAFVTRSHA